jgi:nitrilase
MKIAAIQTVSGTDLGANLVAGRRLLEEAASQGAQLACLPEYFCLMGAKDTDKLAIAENLADPAGAAPIQSMLRQSAMDLQMTVVGGTLPLKTDVPNKVRNSTLVFRPDGTVAARYDKIHLFRLDNGQEQFDEARVLQAGSEPVAFELDGLRVGLSICYDLRFPELYRALSTPAPCDLMLVPSAFTHTTGQAHWEVLLRARAIENQCYVLAAAQGGQHQNGRRTWGHSMVVNPWGEVVAVRPDSEGVVVAELDVDTVAKARQRIPALSHRRL